MRPAPPRRFAEIPATMVHAPSGMRVWLIEPLGLLTQVSETQTIADLAMAQWLSGPVTEALLAQRRGDERLLFVHEWSAMTGYTRETRVEMTEWALRIRKHIARVVVHLGPEAPALVKMGISVASTALTMASVELDLVRDIDAALDEIDARPRR
jgi:hypothetical protein